MTTGKLTLDDIARMAGVSRATASRIINGQVGSRSKARARVLQIVEETGFHPNSAARSLASQNTFVIGHIIPQRADFILADPFFTQLSQAIARRFTQSKYILALFLITSDDEVRKLYSRIANKGLLDGVIVQGGQGHFDYELIDKLLSNNIPFVINGRPPDSFPDVSYVDIDDIHGAYNAVSHLLGLGRKRIATVTGNLDVIPGPGVDRLEGYRKAFRERGLLVKDELISVADFTEEGGYYAAKNLLNQSPDAIFVASDRMATGVLRALREAGISVPDDIAIVGFDDLAPSQQADPPLTTVRLPVEAVGRSLVDMLFDIIGHGSEPPRRLAYGTELIVRKSCGAVNGKQK